ncbi:lactate utilization protein [Chloroflexota bacterium]
MIDETDLSQEVKWFYADRAKKAVSVIHKKNINAQYMPNRKEALEAVMNMIPEGVTVVRGDSMSVDEVGVISEVRKRAKNKLIDPFLRDAEGYYKAEHEERMRMEREAFTADIYITGANAITLDGKIVSTDGVGNRVAPVIFGPKKVILVIGANKIVKDLDQALRRIHEVAAPINAKRHALHYHRPEIGELPCAKTGICVDCNHDWRICRYTVIIEGSQIRDKGRINVVLVGEQLGI